MIRDMLTGRDVLTRRDGTAPRDVPPGHDPTPSPKDGVPRTLIDDEVTGDMTVARPRGSWLSRLDRRTRSILTGAAAATLIVNAGAAWTYWHITDSETGRAQAMTVVEMNLRGRSDLNRQLSPGRTGDLTVTVTNDNDFPIRISSVSPGEGKIIADDEHREDGCVSTGVVVTHDSVKVQWKVPRNTVGAFTVPDGLAMTTDSDKACAGATFTVPVLVAGLAGAA